MVSDMGEVAERRPHRDESEYFERSCVLIPGGMMTAVLYAVIKRVLESSPGPGQREVMHEPVHGTLVTPMLIVDLADPSVAEVLAGRLGAFRRDSPEGISIPLSMQICTSVEFEVDAEAGMMQIRRQGGQAELLFEVPVTDRYLYFLSVTHNVSVNIICGERKWWVTVVNRSRWNHFPVVAAFRKKYTAQIMSNSPRWIAVSVTPDVMVTDFQEVYAWSYGASRIERNIPKLDSFEPDSCVRCDFEGELNREHCTPKWLADRLKVEPVVGLITCPDCNGGFRAMEKAVSEVHAAGLFRDSAYEALIYLWSLKTALMLTAMSNIMFPAWMWHVVDGRTPPDTLHMFRINIAEPDNGGYLYTVTSFPHQMGEAFACSLHFENDMFLIVNSPEHKIPLDFLSDRGDNEPVHEAAVRHYFGVALERGPATLKPTTRR